MNTNTKVLASINLQSSTLHSGDTEIIKAVVETKNGNKAVFTKHKPKVADTFANQKLKVCVDAYKHMVSDDYISSRISPRDWKRLSKKQRLNAHLEDIAADMNGVLIGFEILED